MPVLARLFETAGLATVLVTNMPYWSEKIGVPRTLGVEFPFGHTLGQPQNTIQQMNVIREALKVLEQAVGPGEIRHFQEIWPNGLEEALRISHPEEPPPIARDMGRYIGSFLRGLRRGRV